MYFLYSMLPYPREMLADTGGDLCFGNVQPNKAAIFESVFTEPPKENDLLKETQQQRYGTITKLYWFLKKIFTYISNSKEKTKSFHDMSCTEALQSDCSLIIVLQTNNKNYHDRHDNSNHRADLRWRKQRKKVQDRMCLAWGYGHPHKWMRCGQSPQDP